MNLLIKFDKISICSAIKILELRVQDKVRPSSQKITIEIWKAAHIGENFIWGKPKQLIKIISIL